MDRGLIRSQQEPTAEQYQGPLSDGDFNESYPISCHRRRRIRLHQHTGDLFGVAGELGDRDPPLRGWVASGHIRVEVNCCGCLIRTMPVTDPLRAGQKTIRVGSRFTVLNIMPERQRLRADFRDCCQDFADVAGETKRHR